MTTLKTWYISTYASRREWIKLKVCFFGGSIGKTCVLILSFKAIPENCISLESWKTQLSNDILNEGINVFCGPLRSKIEMTNVIANHFSRCGYTVVLYTSYILKNRQTYDSYFWRRGWTTGTCWYCLCDYIITVCMVQFLCFIYFIVLSLYLYLLESFVASCK